MKEHAETPPHLGDLALVHRRDFFAENFDRAGVRLHHADDVAQQRALAATAPAHDDERLAAIDVERDIVDHAALAEFSDEIGDFDDWLGIWFHAPKKKIAVRMAFVTSMASSACTTAEVVAWPTPSAPPSTCRPALQAIVMMIQAKTTLLIMPE